MIILSLSGWGSLGLSSFPRKSSEQGFDVFESGFVGLFLAVFGALLLNFWVGLGLNPGQWTIGIGLALFVLSCFRRPGWIAQAGFVVLITSAIGLFYRNLSFGYDAGLYHIPYMNWIGNGPVPLGLANLETRFGFNSAWLLAVSALRTDSVSGWYHLIHAEIAIRSLTIAWLAWRFHAALCKGWNRRAVIYGVSAAIISTYLVALGWATSTDQAANLCAFMAWVLFSAQMLREESDSDDSPLLVALLATLAITFKVSMLPILVLPAALLVLALRQQESVFDRKLWAWTSFLAAFGFTWLVRSLFMSGCAFFPASGTCVELPWSVPPQKVEDTATIIMAFARIPNQNWVSAVSFWDMAWVPVWFASAGKTIPFLSIYAAAIFASVSAILLRRRAEPMLDRSHASRGWLMLSLITATFGLVLWLIKAPGPRFSWAFFSIITATLICSTLFVREIYLPKFDPAISLRGLAAFGWTYLALIFWTMSDWAPAKLPEQQVEKIQAANGWSAWHPTAGDQCWTHFPCAPYPIRSIKAQQIDGRWRFEAIAKSK